MRRVVRVVEPAILLVSDGSAAGDTVPQEHRVLPSTVLSNQIHHSYTLLATHSTDVLTLPDNQLLIGCAAQLTPDQFANICGPSVKHCRSISSYIHC